MLRFVILTIATLWLAACSQAPTIIQTSPASDDLPEQWQIKAKLGIRTANDNGSVTLDWQQQEDAYTIRVQGPLGQGNAVINGNAFFITIEQPGKPSVSSNNAQELIRDTFGWTLPLDNFRYWVRGLVNPNIPIDNAVYDKQNTLTNLDQSQWQLSYSRYQPVANWQLPGRIRGQQGDTQFTLIIREWLLL